MSTLAADDRQHPLMSNRPHEHGWQVQSRHPTSAGWLLYVRCDGCRIWRVDLQGHDQVAPMPISKEVTR